MQSAFSSAPRCSRRSHLCSLAAAVVLASIAAVDSGLARASAQEIVELKMSLDFRAYGPNAPMVYAQESGLFRDAGANVTIDNSGGSGDAINRVASGAYQLGYADISTLAEFWARNPAIAPKLVLAILDRSPQSIVSLKKANIIKIQDVKGRKIGTGQADATARMFPAVLKVNGIDVETVKRQALDQKLRDPMLLRGDVDAVIGFDSTILFNLKSQNIRPEDANVIYFADNGFDFYGNGLIVSRALIDSNPELVRKLTRAVAKAWVASAANPAAAVSAVARRDPLTNVGLETERLKWVVDKNLVTAATKANGVGFVDPQKLEAGLKTVAEGFSLPTVPKPSDIYDDRFVPAAEDRKLPQ